jgi:hypothetical protein
MKRKHTPHRRKGYKRRPAFQLSYCGTPFIGFDPSPKGDCTGVIVIDIDFREVESRVFQDLCQKMRGVTDHIASHPILGVTTFRQRPTPHHIDRMSAEEFWKGVFPPVSINLEDLAVHIPPGILPALDLCRQLAAKKDMDVFLREAGIPENIINPPADSQ